MYVHCWFVFLAQGSNCTSFCFAARHFWPLFPKKFSICSRESPRSVNACVPTGIWPSVQPSAAKVLLPWGACARHLAVADLTIPLVARVLSGNLFPMVFFNGEIFRYVFGAFELMNYPSSLQTHVDTFLKKYSICLLSSTILLSSFGPAVQIFPSPSVILMVSHFCDLE